MPPITAPPNDVRPFSLRLFGTFTARVGDNPLPKLRGRKDQWLLALLALRAQAPVERGWLSAALWPDSTDEDALYNLRRSLSSLRAALGTEAFRIVSPTPRTLQIDLSHADCDVAEFDAAIVRGDETAMREAVSHYHGPLLLGCLEEWVMPEREEREQAVLRALERLASTAQRGGELADAANLLRRVLDIDPHRETALRSLLTILAAQGGHAAAAEAYRVFRQRLYRELNAAPSPETVALARQIRAQANAAAQPETVYSASASLTETPLSLPVPLTSLVGRAQEIEEVIRAVNRSRLVTLTGTGGVGKTRLAMAAAHRLHEEFEDGAWFADLSPLTDDTLIVQALLSALRIRETAGRTPLESLTDVLLSKRLLLVLDNCEHLASASAQVSQSLLEQCPHLHILATSREVLGITGELTWRVPSLTLAAESQGNFAESTAIELFIARTGQANRGFQPAPQDYAVIARICAQLDGIPLAIEMAAARTRAMPIGQISARLSDAFQLLSAPGGRRPARQQTLRATLDWSYQLLSTQEQTLLSRLSLFAGGATLNAVEAICSDASAAILDRLGSLIDKSLVIYDEQEGLGRYRLLETVKQYARERLREQGATEEAWERYARWYLALAEEAHQYLRGPEQTLWVVRLEAEHDNLRTALAWCEADEAQSEMALRLAGSLWLFWYVRGYWSEGRSHLNAAFARGSVAHAPQAWISVLNGLGMMALLQGDSSEAGKHYAQALILSRQSGDRENEVQQLLGLGWAARDRGDSAASQSYFEQSLALTQEIGDRSGEANNLQALGWMAYDQNRAADAFAYFEQSLTLTREIGDVNNEAAALHGLGSISATLENTEDACSYFEQSLAIARQTGSRRIEALNLLYLGSIALNQSQIQVARIYLNQSLTIMREIGDSGRVQEALLRLEAADALETNSA